MIVNGKKTILVIDDEVNIRESFSLIFEDNYNVLTAGNGESALKKIKEEKVDLIFLDVRLPGMDGIEFLKNLKQVDPKIPVIVVTGTSDLTITHEALKEGAIEYVLKPFNVSQVMSLTDEVFGKEHF